MADGANFSIVDADPAVAYRLSRFAFLRREADGLVIESPRSKVRVSLHGALALAVVAALAAPCNASDLHAAIEGLSRDAAVACVSVLASADLIGPIDQAGALAEDLDRALAHWEFHDLLFHSRSRLGRHDNRAGGTFRFESRFPPLPALKRPPASDVIALRQPDLANIARRDRSLTEILQARRSIRRYGTEPITLEQLGEFLFRIGRVEEVFAPEPKGGRPYEISRRPYPSGGAAYDLEIYPAVKLCTGLATGLYHYDPFSHALRSIDVCRGRLDALLADAQGTAKMLFTPQIVIVLASRFQRLSWKYEMLAYATTLKNVGVLFQTMYLVATAMDLAPCALGTGNSDLFAAAAGTDYFGETSVGEFLLGSMPTAG
jgi:SagB-type dehydrogenase family enzyme